MPTDEGVTAMMFEAQYVIDRGGVSAGTYLERSFEAARDWLIAYARECKSRWAITAQFADADVVYDRWLDELSKMTEPFTAKIPQSYTTLSVCIAEPWRKH